MGETANTPPTLRERVANLVLAADNAPTFGGLRQHLTEAAGFAVAVVERLEFDEKTGTQLIDDLQSLKVGYSAMQMSVVELTTALRDQAGVIAEQAARIAKTEGDFAELLAKLAEIEARLPEA